MYDTEDAMQSGQEIECEREKAKNFILPLLLLAFKFIFGLF
jgi:hypothetical protein